MAHQEVALKWDVYAAHSEAKTRDRIKQAKMRDRIEEKTGPAAARGPAVRAGAQALHGRGRLFDGDRREDTPFGQESESAELKKGGLAKLSNAPPWPNYRDKSPQALYVNSVRG